MTVRRRTVGGWWIGLSAFAMTAASLIVFTPPAQAQMMSDSYTFLKAVRDRDGNKAQPLLDKPGTTIINSREQSSGETALIIVVKGRDPTWTRFLLAKGADTAVRDGSGETALTNAARIGWSDGVELLLAAGARVDLANARGETPLILAVQGRNLPMVRTLLARGANPTVSDRTSGQSARDYAMRDPRAAAIVRMMDEAKAQPRAKVAGPSL